MAATIALMIAPQRIVFGGGVMRSPDLLPWIRTSMEGMLAGYHQSTDSFGSIEDLVCLTRLDGRAGLLGALLLAKEAAASRLARLR
jgi:fructokinase